MEQLAHFVTKSFEYNNNRVMDVINMTQNTRSMLCGDPFRSVASVDRISAKSAQRVEDDASSGIDDEDDTMDIDITDFSSEDEERGAIKVTDKRAAEIDCIRRDGSVLGSTLLRMSASNCRNTVGRVSTEDGLGKVVVSGLILESSSNVLSMQTTQRDIRKKHATKNWLISDSPKRTEEPGKLATFKMKHVNTTIPKNIFSVPFRRRRH